MKEEAEEDGGDRSSITIIINYYSTRQLQAAGFDAIEMEENTGRPRDFRPIATTLPTGAIKRRPIRFD